MQKTLTVSLIFVLLSILSYAQRIDNTASFLSAGADQYVRFHYDNDFWGKTDYYYTQGYELEVVHPILRASPVSRILLRLKQGESKYGLAFEHYGFTPTSIKSDVILTKDRPFAGVIMLKSFSISIDTVKKQRLATILSTGMIGPAAFAGRMQATIHRWSGDQTPHGWQYQIGNDVVLNYAIDHEKEIFNYPNLVSLNTNLQARLGTLSDKVQAGFTLTLGRFHSPFETSKNKGLKNFQIYAYSQPLVGLVGYDSSMQGGLFNRHSPYTLARSQISRVTFQNNFGLAVGFWKVYAAYYRTYLTREFKTGRDHVWGGVKIGLAF